MDEILVRIDFTVEADKFELMRTFIDMDDLEFENAKNIALVLLGRGKGIEVSVSPAGAKGEHVAMGESEVNTILHALRCLQQSSSSPNNCLLGECNHFEESPILTKEQIDSLCERLRIP